MNKTTVIETFDNHDKLLTALSASESIALTIMRRL